ncbi:MAG: enoyl-CoA hydratase/isomerase family protein, partial [Anaerolineae bacterium]|nr:enoyl-CoA hydratase/isomerase family protein [Anaerolineae bacterium]
MPYETILVEPDPPLAIVRLNRPKVLNALNSAVIAELVDALESLDRDPAVRCIILTGNERAFAAGADISEMADLTIADQLQRDQFAAWDRIRRVRKPLIAAVSGYALGGGCEVALMCDLIVASETARFGQPEINLGIIPGAGGTQRWAQAVGKARAMEVCLTGDAITAEQALAWGLVNRVAPADTYLDEAKALALKLAAKPPLAAQLVKESVNDVFNDYLERGLTAERKNFYLLFGTEDQKEGMRAFV